MTPRQHQILGADWALKTIRKYGLAYLSWQERTGKTLTALVTVENSMAKSCLIVTKKRAIEGWVETLDKWTHSTLFEVINYESLHKVSNDFDFIILDEAHHAISGKPKKSKAWKEAYKKTKGKPILYLSATPYAENLGLIFNQLALSSYSPFKNYINFYKWFSDYGIPHKTRTPYGLVETYSKYKEEEILNILAPYFNFKTRSEVGIEHEPSVNLVVVPLTLETKQVIQQTIEDQIFISNNIQLLLDSDMKTRMVHYQLEGGTLKIDDNKFIYTTSGREKIEYIKSNYNQNKIAIMAHFIAERSLLEKMFPKALILSSDGHAEGVDLHKIDKLIIYSMSFKTSKYTQRLARQANHNRDTPIIVDILVADKPGIGKAVYEAVAIKKVNFDKNSYLRKW